MAISAPDLARIKKWCDAQWPPEMWPRVRVEAEVKGNVVTLVEVRALDGGGVGAGGGFVADGAVGAGGDEGPLDQIRAPFARLRFTQSTGLWQLYWSDSNSRFHLYQHLRPTTSLRKVLNYIESGKDPIFFG